MKGDVMTIKSTLIAATVLGAAILAVGGALAGPEKVNYPTAQAQIRFQDLL